MSVRKKTQAVTRVLHVEAENGPAAESRARPKERWSRSEDEEDAEDSDDGTRCTEIKGDGSRCTRSIFDDELRVCRLHVEAARKRAELVRKAAEAEAEAQTAGPSAPTPADEPLVIQSVARVGIDMEIPEGPPRVNTTSRPDSPRALLMQKSTYDSSSRLSPHPAHGSVPATPLASGVRH